MMCSLVSSLSGVETEENNLLSYTETEIDMEMHFILIILIN